MLGRLSWGYFDISRQTYSSDFRVVLTVLELELTILALELTILALGLTVLALVLTILAPEIIKYGRPRGAEKISNPIEMAENESLSMLSFTGCDIVTVLVMDRF